MVLVVLSATGLYFVAQRSLPTLDGIVSYPELSRGGVVKFDDRSVPYIEAATELDLYRIQGYITAQDRLVQMDILRRKALGELSEVFGSQSLPNDKLMRTIGIGRTVKEELKTLPRELRTALDCYAQGVNTYITTSGDHLPVEFTLLGTRPRQWRPEDTLAILKYSQYQLDESWRLDELRQNILDKVGDKMAGKLFERVFEAPPAVNAQSGAGGGNPKTNTNTNANASDSGSAGSAGGNGAGSGGSKSAAVGGTSAGTSPGTKNTGSSATKSAVGSNGTGANKVKPHPIVKPHPVVSPRPAVRPFAAPSGLNPLPQGNDSPSRDRLNALPDGMDSFVRSGLKALPAEKISPGRGSNGWLVSSAMSDSKGALLALDRHNAFSLPVDWHLVSMRCPDMHIAGATIPGVPGVMCGRSDKIAWGVVALKADVQDLYLEQFSPQMPGKYKIPTGWATANEIVEEIPVRFSGSLFSTSSLVHKVMVTRHGPLLTRSQDSAVALSWVGTHELGHPAKSAGLLEVIYQFNHAENWQKFQAALQKYTGSPMTCPLW